MYIYTWYIFIYELRSITYKRIKLTPLIDQTNIFYLLYTFINYRIYMTSYFFFAFRQKPNLIITPNISKLFWLFLIWYLKIPYLWIKYGYKYFISDKQYFSQILYKELSTIFEHLQHTALEILNHRIYTNDFIKIKNVVSTVQSKNIKATDLYQPMKEHFQKTDTILNSDSNSLISFNLKIFDYNKHTKKIYHHASEKIYNSNTQLVATSNVPMDVEPKYILNSIEEFTQLNASNPCTVAYNSINTINVIEKPIMLPAMRISNILFEKLKKNPISPFSEINIPSHHFSLYQEIVAEQNRFAMALGFNNKELDIFKGLIGDAQFKKQWLSLTLLELEGLFDQLCTLRENS